VAAIPNVTAESELMHLARLIGPDFQLLQAFLTDLTASGQQAPSDRLVPIEKVADARLSSFPNRT
jgi:hypothetical protein